MMMLMLKRQNVPLDRDVILLAESGEEGAPDVGAQFMAGSHLDAINAEFGAHSDQERILESELHRFVRFQYDVVVELARAR